MKKILAVAESEWWRIDAAVKITGISKAKIYELISKHQIRSACLRDGHQSRGTRLIHAASLRAFIEAHAEGPVGQESPSNDNAAGK